MSTKKRRFCYSQRLIYADRLRWFTSLHWNIKVKFKLKAIVLYLKIIYRNHWSKQIKSVMMLNLVISVSVHGSFCYVSFLFFFTIVVLVSNESAAIKRLGRKDEENEGRKRNVQWSIIFLFESSEQRRPESIHSNCKTPRIGPARR